MNITKMSAVKEIRNKAMLRNSYQLEIEKKWQLSAKMLSALCFLFLLHGTFVPVASYASGKDAPEEPVVEWEKRQNAEQRLRAYGTDLLGDGIDPHTGSISFQHTDVSLPGNNGLEVAVRRKISQGEFYARTENVEFADWQLDVPRLHILHLPGDFGGNRCSDSFDNNLPLYRTWSGADTSNSEYSQGLVLEAPGASATQVLEYTQPDSRWPGPTSHVTTNGWWFRCISATDSTGSPSGEGFEGHAPNGDVYLFNRVIVRTAPSLGGTSGSFISRKITTLAATRVTDVHQNSVTYDYDNMNRLRSIESTDGREITLHYISFTKIVSYVKANGRQWGYQYSTTDYFNPSWISSHPSASRLTLDRVTRPDGRSWIYDLDALQAKPGPGPNCIQVDNVISLTHPTGVRGDFHLVENIHRQSYGAQTRVGNTFCPEDPGPGVDNGPFSVTFMETMAVRAKTLTGPGIPTYEWLFVYENENDGEAGSSSSLCADEAADPASECTNWTEVTEPDGRHTTYFHLWNGESLGGKLLRKEIRQDSKTGDLLERTDYEYLLEGGVGESIARFGPSPATILAPAHTKEVVIDRSGDTFTTTNTYVTDPTASNYSWGRPTKVVRSTSLSSDQRTVDTTYMHYKLKWILGLSDTVTRNGTLFDDFDYDTLGRLRVHKRFGTTEDHEWRKYDYHTTQGQKSLVSKVTDALDQETELNNYWRGIPQELIRSDDEILTRVVDNNGWVTSSTNAEGHTTNFDYNDIGWLQQVVPPEGNAPKANTDIAYTFNADGVKQIITKSNLQTIVQYDGMLRPRLETMKDLSRPASISYSRSEFDSQGRPTFKSYPSSSVGAPNGVEMQYDALGRSVRTEQNVFPYAVTMTEYLPSYKVEVTDPRGHKTTTTWLAFGAPASTGPQNQSDEIKAWDRDLPILIDTPLGADKEYVYDNFGNLDLETFGPAETDYEYDEKNRLYSVTDPDMDISYTYYDGNYRPIVSVDGEGRKTRTVYDSIGRVTKVIRAWAGLNNGTGATLDCDQMRVDTQNDPDSLQQCYSETHYTADSQIDWVQDANKNRTKYAYDELNRLTHSYFPQKSAVGAGQHSLTDFEKLTYNELDQAIEKRTRKGDFITYNTDALGRLLDRYVPDAPTHTVDNGREVSHSFTHDAWGHILTAKHDGQTLSYDYDDIGRVTSQTYAGDNIVRYQWDKGNNLEKLTWPDNFAIDYKWDSNNRIYEAKLNSRLLAKVEYDDLSRRSLVTFENGTTVDHEWSPRGDLDYHNQSFSGSALNVGYDYNGVGQMLSRTMSDVSYSWNAATPGSQSYAINGLNQYTSVEGAAIVHDENGNTTHDNLGRVFTYDSENVLRTVTGLAGGAAQYKYHADGSRRQKTHSGTSTVHYYMGGLGYLDEGDTAFAADQEIGEYSSSGALLKRFIRLPGSIDETFLMIDESSGSAVETWAHMDRQGSVIATTNGSGVVQGKYRYSPYGVPGSEGATGFPFRYTGQKLDAETGLYYYKARYYSADLGRFLQTDPIGYQDQMNMYSYVGNDPLNLIDPSGMEGISWVTNKNGGLVSVTASELTAHNVKVQASRRDKVENGGGVIIDAKAAELGAINKSTQDFQDNMVAIATYPAALFNPGMAIAVAFGSEAQEHGPVSPEVFKAVGTEVVLGKADTVLDAGAAAVRLGGKGDAGTEIIAGAVEGLKTSIQVTGAVSTATDIVETINPPQGFKKAWFPTRIEREP